jgi:glycine/D-amino acid oxidase-like deaminating enzyme
VVHARQILLATNGYLPGVLPPALRHRTLPIISNIIVTRPLSEAEWGAYGYHSETPMFDTRHLLSYWRRLPDGRLLFGARGDLCGDDASGQRQRALLQAQLAARFPAWAGVEVDYFWRGLIAANRSLLPQYGALPHDASVWYAAGCFGSGVSTMPWLGRALARAMAGRPATPSEAACAMHGLAPRLPPATVLQKLGLRLAYTAYAWRDRFSEPA